jgi:dTDP-4-dehydrorhamnose 3,5-epimerase
VAGATGGADERAINRVTDVQIEQLEIADAWVCTPTVHGDARGSFVEWFRGDHLADATGRAFEPIQANHSVSRRGTVRGIHYALVPPGQAKYVFCTRGAVLDVVVDIRDGSPTYGATAAVRLDDEERRAVFIAEGLGNAFCALTETAEVTYLVSTTYNPAAERTISPVDPALAMPWPDDVELVLSDRDRAAPTLAAARQSGDLPSYDACRQRYRDLTHGP